ncbi:MAG TPA: hypothetical protein VME66_11340 [Candidatus Acidoferrales bacterium]|nr:hypothetical protein [Candidatus Acidoferrales bacterium]
MKRILTLAIIALTIWVGYEVYAAGNDEVGPPGSVPNVLRSGEASGFHIATKSWSFDYDSVIASADNSVMDMTGIHDGIFYKAGKPYLRLRAQHVTVNMTTKSFVATGPLHIETIGQPRKRTLDTTAATWDDSQKLLTLANKTTVATAGDDQPLVAGKITINVRTGDVHIDQISGHVAF